MLVLAPERVSARVPVLVRVPVFALERVPVLVRVPVFALERVPVLVRVPVFVLERVLVPVFVLERVLVPVFVLERVLVPVFVLERCSCGCLWWCRCVRRSGWSWWDRAGVGSADRVSGSVSVGGHGRRSARSASVQVSASPVRSVSRVSRRAHVARLDVPDGRERVRLEVFLALQVIALDGSRDNGVLVRRGPWSSAAILPT